MPGRAPPSRAASAAATSRRAPLLWSAPASPGACLPAQRNAANRRAAALSPAAEPARLLAGWLAYSADGGACSLPTSAAAAVAAAAAQHLLLNRLAAAAASAPPPAQQAQQPQTRHTTLLLQQQQHLWRAAAAAGTGARVGALLAQRAAAAALPRSRATRVAVICAMRRC